jgi:hypothetical protein
MPLFEIVSIAVLAAVAWLWFDSIKVREIAVRAARSACAAEDYQFLDETVSIASLKPVRDDDGRMVLRRSYAFEYSDTGNNRRPGSVVMHGQEVLMVNVGLRVVGDAC